MGCAVATLQTTGSARAMYERIGFRVVSSYAVFEG